jgi:hypothetical protein
LDPWELFLVYRRTCYWPAQFGFQRERFTRRATNQRVFLRLPLKKHFSFRKRLKFTSHEGTNLLPRKAQSCLSGKREKVFSFFFVRGTSLLLVEAHICFHEKYNCASSERGKTCSWFNFFVKKKFVETYQHEI